jgi:segregation and condensation protein B
MTGNDERQMPNDELTVEPASVGESDSTTKTPRHEEEATNAETVGCPASEPIGDHLATMAEASVADCSSVEVLAPEPEPLDPGTLEPALPDPNSPLPTPTDDSSFDIRHSEIPAPAPLPPAQVIEALLFAADAPVKLDRLAELGEVEPESARAVIDELNAKYQETGRTFRIQRVAQGFQLYTMPEYAEFVRRLYQHQYTHKLSRAALEVLAIIAYKQPVTRPEVEQLRGVDCSGPLVTLLERRLIATYGRASRPGNPFLYRTTPEFLRYFGLAGLEDLPRMEEIGEFLARRETDPDGSEPEKGETFDSLAMDGGHKDAAPEDAR